MFQPIEETGCLVFHFQSALYCGLHAMPETQSNMSYCTLGLFGTVFGSGTKSTSRLPSLKQFPLLFLHNDQHVDFF